MISMIEHTLSSESRYQLLKLIIKFVARLTYRISNIFTLIIQLQALKCKPSAQLHSMLQQPAQMIQALLVK